MKQNLEQLAQEWKAIGGTGEVPRLEAGDYQARAEDVVEARYPKAIDAVYSSFVKSLINVQLPEILKSRGIDYKGADTTDADLLNAYKVVAQLELDMFSVSSGGFNRGLLAKYFDSAGKIYPEGGNRGTFDEEILTEVEKRAGIFNKFAFRQTFEQFAPKSSQEMDSSPFFEDNYGIRQFAEAYSTHASFLDALAIAQEEVYRNGLSRIGHFRAIGYPGYSAEKVGNSIPLKFVRPLVKYIQMHKEKPYTSGFDGESWDFEKVFSIS